MFTTWKIPEMCQTKHLHCNISMREIPRKLEYLLRILFNFLYNCTSIAYNDIWA